MGPVRRTHSNRQIVARSRKKSRIPNDMVGIAGVHYVAYALSKRGMVALPTTRNTAGYDLVVTNRAGTKHANIQVKAAQRHPNFWPMPRFNKIRHGNNDYYVLVRRLAEAGPPECFRVSGREARAHVKRIQQSQRRHGRGDFPCIYVAGKHAKTGVREAWRKAWDEWAS